MVLAVDIAGAGDGSEPEGGGMVVPSVLMHVRISFRFRGNTARHLHPTRHQRYGTSRGSTCAEARRLSR